ncbi:MAG: 3-deoxy-manno-octulosonate cytidylyltransferase [Candidatus Latescibacterota bacterium]|nr:MAG: 3-deoxy-manno-octulosonate cytidylyltransferase [Candidatus Latescibacterota bacterium]
MTTPGFAVVLPARYGSTRFPGKPLAVIAGKPLIEWVYRRAKDIRGAAAVIVATDHKTIAETVERFGGRVVMTSGDHRTGTDRVAEVASSLDCEHIVNLQGDEPIFPPRLVEEMVEVSGRTPKIDIVTACHPIFECDEFENPNCVKVVMDRSGRALYFSRLPIPFRRGDTSRGEDHRVESESPIGYRHIGIYVFRKESLLWLSRASRTPLEVSEGLEQLRALENGMAIQVVKSAQPTVGVDVPDDIKSVEKALSTT